jgi:SpoVK/Ycf46/Vps4 family AAA+-type ATPase
MVLKGETKERLGRVIHEYRQRDTLFLYNLKPRRKILLIGPPGTGKTMTAQALAGELHFHLFTVTLESVISKYMGETAAKLKLIFDSMDAVPGVYFFDEFDAIGSKRSANNDVGEIRRVLNSFLQFLENDYSESLVVAATNHPELLDPALFRRFDDVIEYTLPDRKMAECIFKNNLALFDTKKVKWNSVLGAIEGMSQADIAKVATEAAKVAVLEGKTIITNKEFDGALADRPINLGNMARANI